MARKKKAASRATPRRSVKKRATPARGGATQVASLFNPSGWMTTLLGTQTGRVLVAEALVAAAGAAAAVLVASRSESGARAGKAMLRAGREGTAKLKEAASEAARSVLGDDNPSQQDLAERAARLRERNQPH